MATHLSILIYFFLLHSFCTNDEIIARIEERISAWTFLPGENSNPLNILNFGPEDNKQKYDFFGNQTKLLLSGPIMATVVLYLSNVSQGGQILLPESEVQSQVDDSDCSDEDDKCLNWGAIGECERNPVFMIGSPDYYGTCRKSCNAC